MADGSTRGWLMLVLVGVAAAPLADADPHNYVQAGLGDLIVVCLDTTPGGGSQGSVGGACGFPAGHVEPNSAGQAILSISDFTQNPTSGTYCQDLNQDGLCGSGGEPALPFCGSVVIDRFQNWNPGHRIQIKVHGPIFGSPLLTACISPGASLQNPSFGTLGSVTHS